MRFTYTYRSSDGQRHTAEIEAESRDAAFGRIRAELGVKPIRVTAAGGEGRAEARPEGGRRTAARWAAAAAAVAAAVAVVWWWGRRGGGGAPELTVMTPQGPVTYAAARPLSRQMIPGDRVRIEAARGGDVFAHSAERWLARYAEPGRAVAALSDERPAEAEFEACLRGPVRVASTDFTEVVDLKRIVEGMKNEMRAYLAGGGTAEQYLAELAKRQKLEISYRENAERRLCEMLSQPKEAYAYWLKANAQLQSMGIYPLALPDALQGYQAGLGLDE